MVTKYMRVAIFCTAALIGASAIGTVCFDKLSSLEAKKMEQPYSFVSLRDKERQLQCMADNVYYEAAGESAEGKIAGVIVFEKRPNNTIFVLENLWLMKHEIRKTINYERIDLITPDKHKEMKADLEKRTGLVINRVEVGKIDFLNDTAQVRIFYFGNEQELSDYHVS